MLRRRGVRWLALACLLLAGLLVPSSSSSTGPAADRDGEDQAASACACSPGRESGPGAGAAQEPVQRREQLQGGGPESERAAAGAEVLLQGGSFTFGAAQSPYPEDMEGPPRVVHVDAFAIDATEVTNEAFAAFAAQTGHRTDAERYGWSFVYERLLEPGLAASITSQVAASPWWLPVQGADWAHPEGPATNVSLRGDHPAVHISWNDAAAFCRWAGKRLPSEHEWEYAARAGKADRLFPWGNNAQKLHARANTFTGSFPDGPTAEDGWLGPAPARSYEPNGFGLYETTGNVWEWTSSPFFPDHLQRTMKEMHYAQRGGSYMCHRDYCYRYRCSARSPNTPDSSAGNNGFRCARSLDLAPGAGGRLRFADARASLPREDL